jgi:DNA-binding transcriptional ArsR family regulator
MDKFHALAEPTRRKIIEMLAREGELSATEICNKFQVSPSAISQHLKVLREANLVQMEKRAQQRIYRINPDAMLEVEDWVRQLTLLWERRFDALDRVLEEEKQKLNPTLKGNSSQEGNTGKGETK